jgi:uncharacterized cupredoxin-like copper-binding protein
MNSTIKTILLTLLTLSVLTIAMIEVSGISTAKLSRMFDFSSDNVETPEAPADPNAAKKEREAKVRAMEKTVIVVKDSVHKFEPIKEGDKARHTYTVENVGDKPLMIANVQVSCGCTAPEFVKETIAPGESGEITLEFNSAGKPGNQRKNALIVCNAKNAPYSIGFEIDVEKK